MDDGDEGAGAFLEDGDVEVFRNLKVADGGEEGEFSSGALVTGKDPRKIARKYQLELCGKALQENVIVYLGTGCGKTHIAVLLIYEMVHLIRNLEKNICVFLAPTVALVEQQARVIEESVDLKVGIYYGNSQHRKRRHDWRKEIEQYEVLVMIPQILLHTLCHCFIKMEQISLLIFDECHHAQLESGHPYAEIMKVFYKTDALKLPRIFGMTASPKLGKGASISGLEALLHAKVCTVEDKDELESFVTSPKVKVYYYGPVLNSISCLYSAKLGEIKQKCISMLSMKIDNHNTLRSMKRALSRLHQNLEICLENLGLLGALLACRILLNGDDFDQAEVVDAEENLGDNSIFVEYLVQAASVFSSDCVGISSTLNDGSDSINLSAEVLTEQVFSKKLLRLIEILSAVRLRADSKCIVFVNRIIIARSLSKILQNLKNLFSWKSDYLVGVHSGLKSKSRKCMNAILKKFHSGELNLLVATKVGEEGLDIQTCCLVVRFDLPDTVSSFIQSRGRARMPQSEYAFLVDSGNKTELHLIKAFTEAEVQMNKEIASRSSNELSVNFEEQTYKVDSTLATISRGYSISLLYNYCSKLPHDEYFNPKPDFYYFDNTDGVVCKIILPANAPIHQIVGRPQSSRKSAKKDACLKACELLHEIGALTSFLLPYDNKKSDNREELMPDSSDSESCEDEVPRGDLYEMLMPAALSEPWTEVENSVHLSSYLIKFNPVPEDRLYKKFGLFMKAILPGEAAKMEVNLHLARGRSVITEFVPSGSVEFRHDEILEAQNFQEMFLKIILDRSEFIPEFVALKESDNLKSASSTCYLLLPVIQDEYRKRIFVDWKTVRRCLSSPIFKVPADVESHEIVPQSSYLHLKSGPTCIDDINNSLVYAPYKRKFFFISSILLEKNAYSQYNASASHVEYIQKTFGIQLSYPEQPLLQVKQLFCLRNLLHNRKLRDAETRELEECFFEMPPELCQLKIIGFSKDIGSSISLLPSIMHHLESLLVAIELKDRFSASFSDGDKVTAYRVLEALTTERCNERLSLERLEVLGDAFLKFAVARHLFLLHNTLDEGQLTRSRSNIINNSHLLKLALMHNIQVYVRDQPFDPCQFFTLGRPCPNVCNEKTEATIHYEGKKNVLHGASVGEVRCSKSHHWLHKKTIADVVEALVGAFIVDSGFKAAIGFLRWIGINVDFEAWQVSDVCSASSRFMPFLKSKDFAALETSIGYQFFHQGLLLEAFLHPSWNKLGGGCYQRLEFLGDAVLDYLITSYLYSVYPRLKPGQMTDLRSMSVNNNAFANVAVSRSFDQFIMCDSSDLCEAINKYADFIKNPLTDTVVPEGPKCPKALGDLVESCVGAILIDTGFDLNAVWKIMLSFLNPITSSSCLQLNPIRELQELRQHHKWELRFPSYKKGGLFFVEAKVVGNDICSSAFASNLSQRVAKNLAAEQLSKKLKAHGYKVKSKLLELEEILRSNDKLEAKLIGFDETPVDVRISAAIEYDGSRMQKLSIDGADSKACFVNKGPTNLCSSSTNPSRKSFLLEKQGLQTTVASEIGHNAKSLATGASERKSAKACLFELCAANSWKPPLFECCNEEGLSYLKLFTSKVVLEVEDDAVELECFGAPKTKKKAAEEHAAEGALWYLRQMDYLPNVAC